MRFIALGRVRQRKAALGRGRAYVAGGRQEDGLP